MPQPARQVSAKTHTQLAREWDALARVRDIQIRSGADVSYTRVLAPELLKLGRHDSWARVLDAGCGTGTLIEALRTQAENVWGVDMSRTSISIAQEHVDKPQREQLVCSTIETFATNFRGPRFSMVVANMVLQDTPNLQNLLSAISHLLLPTGTFLLSVTHPCYWPRYWRYEKAPWFRYQDEICIEAPFRISGARKPIGPSTHYHRPITMYLQALKVAGFCTEECREPMPSGGVARAYSRPWQFPRFLLLRCSRT
jgi:2-polyprenyl-3-methyl-5-hydroxy-6-metoxy-1,4-benzoquinol methylase